LHYTTPIEGDPARGRQLAFDRARGGSCVACHVLGKDTPAQPGNVGPDLSAVGAARGDDWLFNYIYDPRDFNRNSIMPPWGAHQIFNAAEIKDIVAFLKTLKQPYVFKDPQENPATRIPPKETRDNLDPTENPAMFALDRGKEIFMRAGANGKACVSCHAAPEAVFRTWAARMPRYEPRLKKVLGVEEFITRHARATTGDEFPMQSDANSGLSIYLHNIANGTPLNPELSDTGAKQAVKHGLELMQRKLGQLNMACVDCHTRERHAFRWARGQYLVEFGGTVAHFPTWRTSRGDIWDIRKRFQWCNVSVRANELPPDASEYGDIELALAVVNKGQKLNSPGIRH
jgi:sulfur-oxidizing protein SoxA